LLFTLKGETFATLDAAKEAGSVTLNYGLQANPTLTIRAQI
jgi:hypothetical protein